METIGSTYLVVADANGVARIGHRRHRVFLQVAPVTAGAWMFSPFTTPNTTQGIGLSANWPLDELKRADVGSAIEGEHTLYGTAAQTFAVIDVAAAP